MSAIISLLDAYGMRSDYGCFQVELCRDEDCIKRLRLEGHHEILDMWLTIRVFGADEENQDLVLDICDMLNYMIESRSCGYSETVVLQLTSALYPEHFKYLAEFGYMSPSEEGGEAPCELKK